MQASSSKCGDTGKRFLLVRSALILCFGTSFWIALMPLRSMIFAQHKDWLDALYLFAQILPVYAGFAVIAWTGMSLRLGRGANTQDLGLVRFSSWWLVWVALLGFGLLSCDVLWNLALGWTSIPITSRASLMTNYTHLPISQGMMIFLLCLVAPIGEELLFRSFVFRWLAFRLPLLAALALSAAFFACMHLAFALGWDSGVLSYFLVGLACAWLYWESRSIIPGIILHISLNVVFVIGTLLK